MRAMIVYESMFGNTHEIANCIAEGLREGHEVSIAPVVDITDHDIEACDVLVVGGPTHAHGLSGRKTRTAARDMAKKDRALTMEHDVTAFGLRDWFRIVGRHDGKMAFAFDTRAAGPPFLTGRASKGIVRRLRRHGFRVAASKSFIVEKTNRLRDGEAARARAWGSMIGAVAGVRPEDAGAAA